MILQSCMTILEFSSPTSDVVLDSTSSTQKILRCQTTLPLLRHLLQVWHFADTINAICVSQSSGIDDEL